MLAFILLAFASLGTTHQQPLGGVRPSSHSQDYTFDPLLHLPGISPYFDAIGFGLEHKAPLGCNVTAASYLVRHAAIYANDDDYETYMEPFLAKLKKSQDASDEWTGPLSMLKTWKSPYTNPEGQMEQITPNGKREAKRTGLHLLKRYPDLVPTLKNVYADKKPRTQVTAHAFVENFPQDVDVLQIADNGEFQAVIPHKTCDAFSKEAGKPEQDEFAATYTKGTIARLQPHAPFTLTTNDIVAMQQLCGYESAISGDDSPLCDLWTPTEIFGYEYLWDLRYFYMVGPGNPLSPYLGFPWLNVTGTLFSRLNSNKSNPEDDGQRFFVSFTHREVPPFLATALGIFNSSSTAAEVFPTDRINFARSWKMAELIPFLGHIGMEKMTCDASSGAPAGTEFVRVIANSAPRPIPACQQGPGASCALHDFLDFVNANLETYGDFERVCRTDERG